MKVARPVRRGESADGPQGTAAGSYPTRELARELGDPLLGTLWADSAEEAVRLAERDAEIARRAMPCASLWAVRVKVESRSQDERPP